MIDEMCIYMYMYCSYMTVDVYKCIKLSAGMRSKWTAGGALAETNGALAEPNEMERLRSQTECQQSQMEPWRK